MFPYNFLSNSSSEIDKLFTSLIFIYIIQQLLGINNSYATVIYIYVLGELYDDYTWKVTKCSYQTVN